MLGSVPVVGVKRRPRALHEDGIQPNQALQQRLVRLHRSRELRTCDACSGTVRRYIQHVTT